MKNINWKLYFFLLFITIIALILGFPYLVTIQGDQITLLLFLTFMLNYAVISAVAIFVGLKLGPKINLDLPILRAYFRKEKLPKAKFTFLYKYAPILGFLLGVIVYDLDLLFIPYLENFSTVVAKSTLDLVWWKRLSVAFYGGIFEEILIRFFALTLYAWILSWIYAKIKKEKVKENKTIIWIAIVLAALLFGIGHLPALMAITTLTPLLVARTIVLNGIPGVFFGWLFYKKGLESAIVSHFFADIAVHLIMPLIFS